MGLALPVRPSFVALPVKNEEEVSPARGGSRGDSVARRSPSEAADEFAMTENTMCAQPLTHNAREGLVTLPPKGADERQLLKF